MAITIGSNISSIRSQRSLQRADAYFSISLERLSSGQRINRASDDAAGLSVSSILRANTRIYAQALRNTNDAVSLMNIADGALGQLSEIVVRQRELAQQAANGSYSSRQRVALQKEANALVREYNRIVQSTSFNGLQIIDGTEDRIVIQQGRGEQESLALALGQKLGGSAGDGTFGDRVTGAGVGHLFVGDLNGDGRDDIVGSGTLFNDAHAYLSNGDGTFTESQYLGVINFLFNGALVDVNNDGRLDVTYEDSGTLYTRIGNGDGTFRNPLSAATFTGGSLFSYADYNGDGLVDLSASGVTAEIFFGRGDGTFMSTGTYSLSSGGGSFSHDFNGDGSVDILHRDGTLLINNGRGSFSITQPASLSGTAVLAVRDLDDDDIVDVLTTAGGAVSMQKGNGNGTFASPVTILTGLVGAARVAVDDFNGDGKIDALIQDFGIQSASLSLGNGNGTFGVARSFSFTTLISAGDAVPTGDFNGDGVTDLVEINDDMGWGESFTRLGNVDPTGRRNNFISPFELTSVAGAREALDRTEALLARISAERGAIGSFQSRLQTSSRVLSTRRLTYEAAASLITDVDVAQESAEMVRTSLLRETGAAVLAQANLQPELALRLLRNPA